MRWSLWALAIGFGVDLILGDPHGWPHPVVAIGKLISVLERGLRRIFPSSPSGERCAGGLLWLLTAAVSFATVEWKSGKRPDDYDDLRQIC